MRRWGLWWIALCACSGPGMTEDGGHVPRADAQPIPWDAGRRPDVPWANPTHPPDEPDLPGLTWCRIKSPGREMHFTAGMPVRVLVDSFDENAYMDGNVWGARQVIFYRDGVEVARADRDPASFNYYEAWIGDLGEGAHGLTAQAVNVDGVTRDCLLPISIYVDPAPTHARTMSLSEDLVLSGSADQVLEDLTIVGNGHHIVGDGFSGRFTLRNAFVTGLGQLGDNGIDLNTSGDVLIEDVLYEHSAPISIEFGASGTFTMRGSELRANNSIVFVPSNPDAGDIVLVRGSSGHRVSGNKIGAGQLHFLYGSDILVGGDTDADSNVLIGPRCVIYLDQCSGSVVRGNYDHHDYTGGWSQGFNSRFWSSTNMLVEHNVIRSGSWPVENPSGEFRYNLVVGVGHQWIRRPESDTRIHHNVFIEENIGADVGSGISGQSDGVTGIQVYNNTMLGGHLPAPAVGLGWGNASFASVRSNFFTGFEAMRFSDASAVVGPEPWDSPDPTGRVLYTDYNCFATPGSTHYNPAIVPGGTVGANGFGGNDCSQTDVDARLTEPIHWPYPVPQGDVWNGLVHVSEILAVYRDWVTPLAGSPLIDAGDPADGDTIDIGAVESPAGSAHDADRFGRFGMP